MSVGLRNRTINVNRATLVAALKENLVIHQKDYAEAVEGYKIKLIEDLTCKLEEVKNTSSDELKNLKTVPFTHPISFEKDFQEAIHFYSASEDELIEVNNEEFRAYFKNEWSWSDMFNNTAMLYKSYQVGKSF